MIYHNNLLLTGSFLTCGTLGFPGMYRDGKQPGNSLIPEGIDGHDNAHHPAHQQQGNHSPQEAGSDR